MTDFEHIDEPLTEEDKALGRETLAMCKANMPGFMDGQFGKGNWFYDEQEKLYITANPHYTGKDGFGYVAFTPEATWFTGVIPHEQMQ